MAGWFLLLTALASAVMVGGRVAADADQHTLVESLTAIASNQAPYVLSGGGRLVSGLTLLTAARFLSRARMVNRRIGRPLAPVLLAMSGALTALSGTLAILLAGLSSEVAASGALSPGYPMAQTISGLRWQTGTIGFVVAGLALILVAHRQWKAGGALRTAAPVTAMTGIAMQFIWVDAATPAHRIIGAAFFVWLVAAGAMLVTGRAENLLPRTPDRQPSA